MEGKKAPSLKTHGRVLGEEKPTDKGRVFKCELCGNETEKYDCEKLVMWRLNEDDCGHFSVSKNTDIGDVMVVIKELCRKFNIKWVFNHD